MIAGMDTATLAVLAGLAGALFAPTAAAAPAAPYTPAPAAAVAPDEPIEAVPAPRSDELVLDNGSTLRGRVLKETDGHLFIDVGYTVLQIPKSIVVERSRAAGAITEVPAEGGARLFSGAEGLAELTLEEAVERFGEGVVVIKQPGALGSGFVVREDGYVITNSHVVQGEIEVTVTVHRKTPDGVEKKVFEEVEIVAINPYVDLALLKIDAEELGDFPLTKVYFGNIDELKVGDPVFAVGAPLGLERSVSEGIVSIRNRAQNGITYIQTTAAINPGNSGGPLFNHKGEVVGVNTWHFQMSEGLNFSIPIDFVKHFIVNRDAFAFDRDNPNSGYRYLAPPRRGEADPLGD